MRAWLLKQLITGKKLQANATDTGGHGGLPQNIFIAPLER